ncbi:MAG: zinc-ribbon domain-containing protein, partial [Planctomycetota bacterium]
MTCPACGVENPLEHRFCMGCGASLARSCPSCGTEA